MAVLLIDVVISSQCLWSWRDISSYESDATSLDSLGTPVTLHNQMICVQPLQYKPLPLLDSSQSQKYLMDVKQEIQVKFRQSPFFITLDEKKCDIERYSDRYQPSHQEVHKKWTPGELQFLALPLAP